MAVSTTNAISGPYTTNGVTTVFPFTFTAPSDDEVDVVLVDSAGIETSLSGYSVTLGQEAGGSVNFSLPPAAGYSLYILLDPSFRQEIAFENGSAWRAEPVNEGYDRSAARDQVLRRDVGRAFKMPLDPEKVAGKFPVVGVGGSAEFASGTGNDPALRSDIAAPEGARLMGLDPVASAPPGSVAEFLQKLNQPTTAKFYAEDGARIQRLRDRVFGGAAAKHTGTNDGSQPDWLTQFLLSLGRTFGFQHVTTFAILSELNTAGQNSILGAAHTADLAAVGNAIGVLGVGINDNTLYSTGAWGGYFEGFQQPGALGPAYAAEFDTINRNAYVTVDPYGQQANQVIALQVASGAEFPGTFDATAILNAQNNGARFGVGFNFGATSLRGTNGDGAGIGHAFQFARGHGMRWLATATEVTSGIYSVGSSGALGQTIWFRDSVVSFENTENGKRTFGVGNIGPIGVNHLEVNNSATGNPAQLLAAGDDANIGIQLLPKGSGFVWLGPFTASADTPTTGYLTVRDSAGTLRKLATIA